MREADINAIREATRFVNDVTAQLRETARQQTMTDTERDAMHAAANAEPSATQYASDLRQRYHRRGIPAVESAVVTATDTKREEKQEKLSPGERAADFAARARARHRQ